MSAPSQKTLDAFIACVGVKNVLTSSDDLTHYTDENRDLYKGKTPLVLKPGSTEEVSAIVKLAVETKTALVPQGGHTGHAAGGMPDESGNQIVVSMERMNRIRHIDIEGNFLIVDAGVILETIRNLADENDRLFPLSLGSQGSCQIGGNISTNAGGTAVLSYGNTREFVLGLEVVLPNGEIWNGLRSLKKDNTGYDLKNLFVGAEGTLGIITGCVIKLFPKPRGKATAFVGLNSPEHALKLLTLASRIAGNMLTTFELMPALAINCTLKHIADTRAPLADEHKWSVLAEISSIRSEEDAASTMQEILENALEDGVCEDATLAQSVDQQKALWRIREMMPIAQRQEGVSIRHDISVPINLMPEFLDRANAIIDAELPDSRRYTFGHMGDGNIHYNLMQPVGSDTDAFLAHRGEMNDLIHALVVEMGGSISAEHGIGRMKRELLAKTKDPVELKLMKSLKATLDPNNIMNPGKVI